MKSISGLRIAIAQLNLLVGDIAGNARKVIDTALRARDEHAADAVIFPELTLTGYPPEDLLLRPGLLPQVEKALAEINREVAGIHLILGYPREGANGLHNSAGVLRDGRILGEYHKQQLPNYSVFDERRYFTPGGSPCIANLNGIHVGLTLCEDIWFPGPAAQAREAGAQLILNLNASPFHAGKWREREETLTRRCAENGLPIVYANLVGGQDELVFEGESLVVDGAGRVIFRAPQFEEGLYWVDFDLLDGRAVPRPAVAVAPLSLEESTYRALVLGVRDYVIKNGFQGVVIGLSGGIDSALTLAIAVDALGPDKVEAVMMPSRYTADISQIDAEAEARALDVHYRVIPIGPAVDTFNEMLAEEFAGTQPDATEENIQARTRGILLMAISNKRGKMVLTTGNKSEMAVGYATLYGDMAGGFAPLKDVPKTLVFRLARWRNAISPVIPERVITRPPSAELAPDQKDEDSLPPYEVLDPILERYVERDYCVAQIVADGYDEATVRRVVGMVNRNEYKRRQAPPGVRVSRRAFGRDRRYPLTSGFSPTHS
ncbi:NAD+ synthase [Endothiovibrio diazotrophicus]